MDPAAYEAWYHTSCGRWIGQREGSLMLELMRPAPGQSLLDVGCGTGYFSRRFAAAGLAVTGIDPDAAMIGWARAQAGAVKYVEGRAEHLPFEDERFDYAAAVTSLCFIEQPAAALAEMWRVSRRGIVLGLLNRHSLLYVKKQGRGGYAGARWDTWAAVRGWIERLAPRPVACTHRTAILLPGGGPLARLAERLLFGVLPWGGFLAVWIGKRG